MSSNNKTIINEGFAKAAALVKASIRSRFVEAGYRIVEHAMENREWLAFTGNTITSYAFGYYEDGVLIEKYVSGENMEKPVRGKVQKGRVVGLKNPYEGSPRSVTGMAKIVNPSGRELSEDFLDGYKPITRKGYCLVITTGTEYSEWLERVANLNTLSETYVSVKSGYVDNILYEEIL